MATKGFTGTIDDISFARLMVLQGPRVCVESPTAWAPTPTGADRTVSFAAGKGYLPGLWHETTGAVTVANAINSSGSDRYDLIVARADWTAKTVTFTAITGTPGAGVPPTPSRTMLTTGVVYDFPLVVCRTVSGGGAYTAGHLFDLRAWGGVGHLVVADATFLTSHDLVAGQRWKSALTNQLYTVNSAGVPIQDNAMANLRQIVAQSIPHNTFTAVTFTAEDFDTAGGHSTSSNTSRYTAQIAGKYQISGGIVYDFTGTTGTRGCRWTKNGVDLNGSQVFVPTTTGGAVPTGVVARTVIVDLALNDYVQLDAYHTQGAALNTLVAAGQQSHMSVVYLGP